MTKAERLDMVISLLAGLVTRILPHTSGMSVGEQIEIADQMQIASELMRDTYTDRILH